VFVNQEFRLILLPSFVCLTGDGVVGSGAGLPSPDSLVPVGMALFGFFPTNV